MDVFHVCGCVTHFYVGKGIVAFMVGIFFRRIPIFFYFVKYKLSSLRSKVNCVLSVLSAICVLFNQWLYLMKMKYV